MLVNLATTVCAQYVRQYFFNQPPGSRQSTAFPLCTSRGHFNACAREDGKYTSQRYSRHHGAIPALCHIFGTCTHYYNVPTTGVVVRLRDALWGTLQRWKYAMCCLPCEFACNGCPLSKQLEQLNTVKLVAPC